MIPPQRFHFAAIISILLFTNAYGQGLIRPDVIGQGPQIACGLPYGYAAVEATEDSLVISWNTVAGASFYLINYRLPGDTSWMQTFSTAAVVTLTGLAPATAYQVRARAFCNGNYGPFSLPNVFLTASPNCLPPDTAYATSITHQNAVIRWDTTGNATSYEVRYRLMFTQDPWSIIASNTDSAFIPQLQENTAYEFQVRSICGGSYGVYSIVRYFTTLPNPVCLAPSGITADSVYQNGTMLHWPAVPYATGYIINYRESGNPFWTPANVINPPFHLSSLLPGVTYEYRIQTVCSFGNSPFSLIGNFTTGPPCPMATGLTTLSVTTTTAVIDWTAVSGSTTYNVRYRPSGSGTWIVLLSNTDSLTLTSLIPSTTYEFQVQSVCGTSTGIYTSSASFSTAAACGIPSGLFTTLVGPTAATLNWSSVAGANSYNILYRPTGTGSWITVSSAGSSATIGFLTPLSGYEFKVQAVCSHGPGAYSGASSFVTLAECAMPTGLYTIAATTNDATLSWSAVSGAVSYNISYRPTGSPTWMVKQSSTVSVTLDSLTPQTTYEYKVQAVCAQDSGQYSLPSTFATGVLCEVPTALTVTAVSYTSVTLDWASIPGTVTYNVRYRATGTVPWMYYPTTNSTLTINGLDPATTYEYQVSTICSGAQSIYSSSGTFSTTGSVAGLPVPDHVVVYILENRAYNQIIGNAAAPRINALANSPNAANFTNAFAITHPSQPNYIHLYAGADHGITNNNITPTQLTAPNLGRALLDAGYTFASYSQGLPSTGFMGASSGLYVRRHNPMTNWIGSGPNQIPANLNKPFSDFPVGNYASLPTVSFVVPDLNCDMHDGTIADGDLWYQQNIESYVNWAKNNNSLFILTFDEDDHSMNNQITTIFAGEMVIQGWYSTQITLHNILRTIEDMYGLPHSGNAANVAPITGIWTNGARLAAEEKEFALRWEIYPNPVVREIQIDIELQEQTRLAYSIYAANGVLVMNEDLGTYDAGIFHLTFPVAEPMLPRGLYFFELRAHDRRFTRKFLRK